MVEEGAASREGRRVLMAEPLVLEICTGCKKQFPGSQMYTFYHYLGGVRVCSPCWDKLEEREKNK